jgi:O-acetyl-ADP-ribose deacetylase (regulator of RNase III)
MIDIRSGNIVHEVTRGVILQQVNAQGVMGSGVAKDIRDKWPVVFEEYSKVLGPAYTQKDSGLHMLGKMIPVQVEKDLWVLNLVSQQFFGREKGRRYTSYDALDVALTRAAEWALSDAWGLEDTWYAQRLPIHFPAIGCGLGGGRWTVVESLIEHRLVGFKKTLWLLPGADQSALTT